LRCVETCLRREMDQDGDKQKLELLQNMSARLLDMLSPPGWVRIKDVPIRKHKWLYRPLGHIHDHFPEHTTIRLTIREDQGENATKAPQPVVMALSVPIDSSFREVIQRALTNLPSGRLGSFCKRIICTPTQPKCADALKHGPPIPHGTTPRGLGVCSAGHVERPEEGHGRGPASQNAGQHSNEMFFPITLWMPSWAHRHMGCEHPDDCPSPRPHQQWSGPGCQGLAPLEPKVWQGLAPDRLPQPPKHWNLLLIGDPNSLPQDRIRQPVIFVLDAKERSFAADPADIETGAGRSLYVSLQTTKSTTVSELVAAVSHECQSRGIHIGLELNGARYTVGSCPIDLIWRQNVNPANLRTCPLSESQRYSRNEQTLYAADCLGWIKEEPRPTIFVFLPPSDSLTNHPAPRRRAEPELPHVGGRKVAAADVASCFTLGTLVLLEDGSYAEVQNLAGSMVHTTDGGSARVSRVHQFHISEAANIANCHGMSSPICSPLVTMCDSLGSRAPLPKLQRCHVQETG